MTINFKEVFANTDPSYMESSLLQRNPGPKSAGSTFLTPITIEDLSTADWKPAEDEAIRPPAQGFVTNIPGLLGIAELDKLNQNKKVVIQPAHKGKAIIKGGVFDGQVAAECATNLKDSEKSSQDFTTLIVGPDRNDPNKLVVWTFFPGPASFKFEDIAYDHICKELGYPVGTERIVMTVAEAIKLGYNYCKDTKEQI